MEGLISGDIFQTSQPITESIAENLLEMPRLRVIQYHDKIPDEISLKILNDKLFTKRKDILFRVYGRYEDIEFINFIPEIERFDWDTIVFGSTKPLLNIKKLKHLGLGLGHPKPKISLKFLLDFKTSLESLSLNGDYKDIITTIPFLRNLKRLWLMSTKLEGFDFLKGMSIETIGNYGNRVKSFDYLSNISTLKKIWIKTNSTIENIDFIKDLSDLEVLELYYVSKITNFPECDHLSKLKTIYASPCNRLENINSVKKLKNCDVFIAGDKIEGKNYMSEITRDRIYK